MTVVPLATPADELDQLGLPNLDDMTMDEWESVQPMATDLADIEGLSLADLESLDNPVLLESLRRILEDADRPQDIVAGFQSAI